MAQFFIDRPVFATVLSIVIMIVGGVAVVGMPIAQYPEIVPPTVSVPAETVTVGEEVMETGPVPRLSEFDPTNPKLPPQICGLLVASVRGTPASSEPPESESVPVPMALALPSTSTPAERVVRPE